MKKIYIPILFICLNSFSQTNSTTNGLVANKAMVVSAREEASKIGVEIMKKGGNAFDAMVATELALAVAYPYAGNLGGGGFMVFRKANGEVGSLDYREKVPNHLCLLAFRELLQEYLPFTTNMVQCQCSKF
jgi:gamma-glutamyltranspeptidase/glutathione hydrolase